MGILAVRADKQVKAVRFTEDAIAVDLMDGRTIIVPLVWHPRLLSTAFRPYQAMQYLTKLDELCLKLILRLPQSLTADESLRLEAGHRQ